MRVNNFCVFIIFFLLILCGCDKEKNNNDTNVITEIEADFSTDDIHEEEKAFLSETEEREDKMEKEVDHAAVLYQTVQKMIDEIDKECLVKPEWFGTTLYTEEDFQEIKQYEMNIILDYLNIKKWQRPTGSYDEVGLPVDEPLGEYSVEKLKEYTKEEHDLTIEYFCGGSLLHKPDKRYIALIIKEYYKDKVQNLYYQIIDYGYLSVMTGSNSLHYGIVGSLEDIELSKIEQGAIGRYVYLWMDEDSNEVNLIYDIREEERESTVGTGTYPTYSQSIWIICKKEGDNYKVKEIIPMILQ